jgi:DNA polymerase II small subunit
MNSELLKQIKEKRLLLEKDLFDLLNSFEDPEATKAILENLQKFSGQKILTKSSLTKNTQYFNSVVNTLSDQHKHTVENIFIKLGISLEIRKETIVQQNSTINSISDRKQNYTIHYADTKADKKIEVADFVGNFRSRYQELQKILMERPQLKNLISINKISQDRQSLSFIGIVTEKRTTKNKNLIIKFEDLTGEINGLVKFDNKELSIIANELQLDDVVGVKASGNREMLFIHDIFFPDAHIPNKTTFKEEVCIAFLSDVHAGSDRHLNQSLDRFINWLNSDHETAKKIKYLFFTGDNVDGVGIFPGQENFLKLKSMKEQYELLASYLKRVPKHITMFMCPGQHDAVRVAEPQPIIDKRYAPQLYEIDNLVLVTNPTLVKFLEGDTVFKVLMYHGASIHTFINEIAELREIKANRSPAKAVRHMLKRRHLAPTHSVVTYIPNIDKDPLVISEVPDVLCTGEVHRLDIENYNGVLIITGSCWQAKTAFEEKVGNIPDPAKVPVLNLKTRELKVFDFGVEEEINREY